MASGSIFEQIIDPANRADPWSLYRELRKTPVTREADGTYVVSRYRDIVALLHDPRISATGGVACRVAWSTWIRRRMTASGGP